MVVNTAVPRRGELAAYYMKQRGIPEENIVRVLLPDERDDQPQTVRRENRRPGAKDTQGARAPAAHPLPAADVRHAAAGGGARDRTGRQTADRRRSSSGGRRPSARSRRCRPAAKEEKERLAKDLAAVDAEIARAQKSDHSASVDSEIALVAAGDYPLAGWLPNPFFLGNRKKELAIDKSRVLMVSRLDGPSEKIVRRIIDDSLAAEKQGLSGTAYFDARWPEPAGAPKGGYEFYDASIHRAARRVAESGRMPVKLDSTERLFQPGDAPDAALYCGWYSLAEVRGRLHVEAGGGRLPHRQQRVHDPEAEGQPGVVQAHAGRGGGGRHRAGG